ncbi:hypothetical protein [uncultured Microbacterium sp.]|uniref:hypothetical protein n=1 Tax=uncultured Microbacterium sp. TaxID=191216 RepID=UPI0025CD2E45|nr:hypothetical protein [uncultured Microbacterium sp.]
MSAMATRPRSRRRGKGSLQSYQTRAGLRWRYQLWIPIDPEQPDAGEKKFSRGGSLTDDDADDAMQEALRKRKNDEKFHGAVATLEAYGSDWLDALTLEPSTLLGYRRQFYNHLVPHLGSKQLDKITGPAIGKVYKTLKERGGREGALEFEHGQQDEHHARGDRGLGDGGRFHHEEPGPTQEDRQGTNGPRYSC